MIHVNYSLFAMCIPMPLMRCGCIFLGFFTVDGEVCGLRAATCAFQFVLTDWSGPPALCGLGLLLGTLNSRAILEAAVSRR